MFCVLLFFLFFFFKQKTAYEMRISDWSSDVCSSDLAAPRRVEGAFEGTPLLLVVACQVAHQVGRFLGMLGVARDGELLAAQRCRGPAVFPRRPRRDAALAFPRAVPAVADRPRIRPLSPEQGAARQEPAAHHSPDELKTPPAATGPPPPP